MIFYFKRELTLKWLFCFETQSLKNTYPSKFEDPVIVPLQEFAWDQYLLEKKRVKDIRGVGDEHSFAWITDLCIVLKKLKQ